MLTGGMLALRALYRYPSAHIDGIYVAIHHAPRHIAAFRATALQTGFLLF